MNGTVNGNNRVEAKLLSIGNSVDEDELEGIPGAWEAWEEGNGGALSVGGSEVQAIAAENKRARTDVFLGNDEHMYDANKPARGPLLDQAARLFQANSTSQGSWLLDIL